MNIPTFDVMNALFDPTEIVSVNLGVDVSSGRRKSIDDMNEI